MISTHYYGGVTVRWDGPAARFLAQLRQTVAVYNSFPTLRRKLGGTEYIVTGRHSPTARETATAKLKRLILNAQA